MTRTKRITSPGSWHIPRKEKKYVLSVSAGPHDGSSLPIGIWIRDHLKFAENMKEVRKILHDRAVILNGHIVTDEHIGIDVFDIISIPKIAKNYLILVDEKGHITQHEISDEAAKQQLVKIADKTTLKGGKTQINLTNGANFISEDLYKAKDTLIVSIDEKDRFAVLEHFPYAVGSTVVIIGGQHTMKSGRISKIYVQQSSLPNRLIIQGNDGTEIETIEDYIYVTGKDESYLKFWGVEA